MQGIGGRLVRLASWRTLLVMALTMGVLGMQTGRGTLAYFTDKAADRDDWDQMLPIAQQYDFKVSGEITGYDTFDNDEVVLWAKPEIPGLAEQREAMVAALNEAGFTVDDKFDFNPHITVAYDWQGEVPTLEQPIPVSFDGLYFYRGENMQKVASGRLAAPIVR